MAMPKSSCIEFLSYDWSVANFGLLETFGLKYEIVAKFPISLTLATKICDDKMGIFAMYSNNVKGEELIPF